MEQPTSPRRRTRAEFEATHEASHALAKRALEEFRAHQARAAAYYQQGAGVLSGSGQGKGQAAMLAALRASGQAGGSGPGAAGSRGVVTTTVDGRKLLYVVQSVLQGLHVAFGVPVPQLEVLQEVAASVSERRSDQASTLQAQEEGLQEQHLQIELAAATQDETSRTDRRRGGGRHRRASHGGAGKPCDARNPRRNSVPGKEGPEQRRGGAGGGACEGKGSGSGQGKGTVLPDPPRETQPDRAQAQAPPHEVLRRTKLSLDRLRDYMQSDPGYTKAMRRLVRRAHDQLGRHISLDEVFMGGKLFDDDEGGP